MRFLAANEECAFFALWCNFHNCHFGIVAVLLCNGRGDVLCLMYRQNTEHYIYFLEEKSQVGQYSIPLRSRLS